MSDMRLNRLVNERKAWRKNRPFGFKAKPVKKKDGTVDLGVWLCTIPGPPKTPWEFGKYNLKILFGAQYPEKAPTIYFDPVIFHPNVYTNGEVCSTLVTEWEVGTSLTDLLTGMQRFLNEPNNASPANGNAQSMNQHKPEQYAKKIREYAKSVS